MSKQESGSFVPEEKQIKPPPPPPINPNTALLVVMREIRDAVKENMEALNSLLTTLVGQTRNEFTTPQGKTTVTTSIKETPAKETPLPMPTLTPETTSATTPIENIKMMFPQDLENLLAFTDEGTYIKVKPRQFLGSDNFAKIASVVRAANGEYKSAGKESHFRIPKR